MTIPQRLFSGFILLTLGLALPQQLPAQQETQRHYRVELMVVRHLGGSSDTAPHQTLRDFSEILDLYAPPLEANATAATSAATLTDVISADAVLAEEEAPPAVRIDDMSDTMREAWRRLRGSAGFRPELFRAWEQSGDSPFPQLRIHDDEVLFSIDPAQQTQDVPVDEYGALVFSDATMQRQEEPGLLPQQDIEPDPIENYYRIDGTATLTRSRFLHLNLDIELREPLFESTGADSATELFDDPLPLDPAPETKVRSGPAAAAAEFRIHQIKQRRQVKTGQMEYFDGPVIGVLAFVIGFDVSKTDAEADVAQP